MKQLSNWHFWYVAIITAGYLVTSVSGRVSNQTLCILALLLVWFPGIISAHDAVSGFTNQGLIVVAAFMTVAPYLEKLPWWGKVIDTVLESKYPRATLLKLSLLAIGLSTVLNHSHVSSILLTHTRSWIERSKPELLIPVTYLVLAGGWCTILSCNSNLILVGMARKAQVVVGPFEFMLVGLCLSAFIVVYIQFIIRFLPGDLRLMRYTKEDVYFSRFEVTRDMMHRIEGKGDAASLALTLNMKSYDLIRLYRSASDEAFRNGDSSWYSEASSKLLSGEVRAVPVNDTSVVQEGDVLVVASTAHDLHSLHNTPFSNSLNSLDQSRSIMVTVVLSDANPIIGRDFDSEDFSKTFVSVPLGIRRAGLVAFEDHTEWKCRAGDTILMLIDDHQLEELRVVHDTSFTGISQIRDPPAFTARVSAINLGQAKSFITVSYPMLFLLLLVALLASSAVDVLKGSMSLSLLLYLCARGNGSFIKPFNGNTLLLAAVLQGFASSINRSGLSTALASLITEATTGPTGAFVFLNVLAVVLTELAEGCTAGILIFPLALQVAESLQVSAKPFVIGLIFSCSTCFIHPPADIKSSFRKQSGGINFKTLILAGIGADLGAFILNCILTPFVFPFHS